jgi:hypothetical protein
MRETASSNGVGVKAYAGTTGVLLAMNLGREPDDDFLGFAIGDKGRLKFLYPYHTHLRGAT